MIEEIVLFLQTFPGYFARLLSVSPLFGNIAILAGLFFTVLLFLVLRRKIKSVVWRLLVAAVMGIGAGLLVSIAVWSWFMFQWASSI